MAEKRRKRHSPEQIVRKLRDADAMLDAGMDLAEVLKALETGESTLERWRRQYGGMKSEEAKRLKHLGQRTRTRGQVTRVSNFRNDAIGGFASNALLSADLGCVIGGTAFQAMRDCCADGANGISATRASSHLKTEVMRSEKQRRTNDESK